MYNSHPPSLPPLLPPSLPPSINLPPSLPPSLPLVTQQIHCPFQPKQSPSLVVDPFVSSCSCASVTAFVQITVFVTAAINHFFSQHSSKSLLRITVFFTACTNHCLCHCSFESLLLSTQLCITVLVTACMNNCLICSLYVNTLATFWLVN